jgi:hypothetical protein
LGSTQKLLLLGIRTTNLKIHWSATAVLSMLNLVPAVLFLLVSGPILFISVLKLPNAYHVASTRSTLQPLPCDSAFPAYFRQDLWFVRVRLLTLAVNNSWIKFKPSYPA